VTGKPISPCLETKINAAASACSGVHRTNRLEAHVDVIVAALWLKSKEPYVRHAEHATQGALVLLIMASALMTTQKLSARVSSISIETLALVTLGTMVPLIAIIGHIPLMHRPGKEIHGEVNFEEATTNNDIGAKIHEHIMEHHEQTEAEVEERQQHLKSPLNHCRGLSGTKTTELGRKKGDGTARTTKITHGTVLMSKMSKFKC
jgi:hypothetical protein